MVVPRKSASLSTTATTTTATTTINGLEMETINSGYDGGNAKYRKRQNRLKKRYQTLCLFFVGILLGIITVSIFFSRDTIRDYPPRIHSIKGILPHDGIRHSHHSPNRDDIKSENNSGSHPWPRWADPKMLPPLPDEDRKTSLMFLTLQEANHDRHEGGYRSHRKDNHFRKEYSSLPQEWEEEAERLEGKGPKVDYTKLDYTYRELLDEPPVEGGYPALKPLGEILEYWPQDNLDNPPPNYYEGLLHFDYMDLNQRAAAKKFRDRELPFKMYNVPELQEANLKWTDEYLAHQFDKPSIHGVCQEAEGNFFSFFRPETWEQSVMGPPPSLDTNLNFATFAKHARYADNVGLAPGEKHFYWQSGAPAQERHKPKRHWSFISLDLPSFSNPEPTFFGFNPPAQKGIQCRFGERGVTAATHYDSGRNMVAMITGAKRYILGPPTVCSHLGIIAEKGHPAFRHSLLNFSHLNLIREGGDKIQGISEEETNWLNLSYDSLAIDTVLKAGEVLYIPSHWFHYITSLQKSAQCNTRSGRNEEGSEEFGGYRDVVKCVGTSA